MKYKTGRDKFVQGTKCVMGKKKGVLMTVNDGEVMRLEPQSV